MMGDFADFMAKWKPQVITWNGRGFDLPVLALRALRFGLDFRWYYRGEGYRYRFSEEGHLDLCDVIADHGAAKMTSLDGAARIVGLPGKDGVDGSQVEALFHAGQMDADATSADIKDLHTYGKQFTTQWVTVHDTDVDTTGVTFDANAAAKTAGATPFKRPENGVFRPGSAFTEFYFTETGDTTILTEVGATAGGFGGLYKLKFATAGADTGTLSLVYLSDIAHTGFDNISFWSDRYLAVVEDAGDTLHKQRDALDSAYLFDLTVDYSKPANQPKRFIAEGRDPSATVSGDNEITGIHISDGDATIAGLLGVNVPQPFMAGWRVFWTQQHGDNVTWELGRTLP